MVINKYYLPAEIRDDLSFEDIVDKLEGIYGFKVILIDPSRVNLEGSIVKEFPPVYLI